MAAQKQSYANHAQYNPLYHYITTPLSLAYVVWAIVRFLRTPGADSLFILFGAVALFGVVGVARLAPLRAQDRLIRLEERLRYAKLLSADLVARTDATFTPRHYIALRFASDGELAELVTRVLANPAMPSKEIKQAIRSWRADTFRV